MFAEMQKTNAIDKVTANNSSTKQEFLVGAVLGKGFHVYTQRNEWVNWGGDTSVVNRSEKSVKLSLQEAEQYAEAHRLPGTAFVIDELPIIQLITRSGVLVVAELFSDDPFGGYLRRPIFWPENLSIDTFIAVLPPAEWRVALHTDRHAQFTSLDGLFFTRKSSPSKNKSHLGWSLKPRSLTCKAINRLVEDLVASLGQAQT